MGIVERLAGHPPSPLTLCEGGGKIPRFARNGSGVQYVAPFVLRTFPPLTGETLCGAADLDGYDVYALVFLVFDGGGVVAEEAQRDIGFV